MMHYYSYEYLSEVTNIKNPAIRRQQDAAYTTLRYQYLEVVQQSREPLSLEQRAHLTLLIALDGFNKLYKKQKLKVELIEFNSRYFVLQEVKTRKRTGFEMPKFDKMSKKIFMLMINACVWSI